MNKVIVFFQNDEKVMKSKFSSEPLNIMFRLFYKVGCENCDDKPTLLEEPILSEPSILSE